MDCVSLGRLVEEVIIELIGTWMVIGFFSAIGWGAAEKAVVDPYVKPAIASMQKTETKQASTDQGSTNESK